MSNPNQADVQAEYELEKLEDFYQKYQKADENVQKAFSNYLNALEQERNAYDF